MDAQIKNLEADLEQAINDYLSGARHINQFEPKNKRAKLMDDLGLKINSKLEQKYSIQLSGLGKNQKSASLTLKCSSSFGDEDLYAKLNEIAEKNSLSLERREIDHCSFPSSGFSERFYGFYQKHRPRRFFNFLKSSYQIKASYLLAFEPGKDKDHYRAGILDMNETDVIVMKRKKEAYKFLEDVLIKINNLI